MLSFKLFPHDKIENLNQIMDVVTRDKDNTGVELAFYTHHNIPTEIKEKLYGLKKKQKSVHSDHKKISLLGLSSIDSGIKSLALSTLEKEYDTIKDIEAFKYIIHAGVGDIHEFDYNKYSFLDLENGISKVLNRGFVPYLEKTYESLDWFYHVYDKAPKELGFCLDIGHVKVWQPSTLDKWLSFIDDISSRGHPINFHIHNNDGSGDHHVNLRTSFINGYLDESEVYAPNGVLPWLKTAHLKYGDESLFTMESHDALDAYDFVKMSIGLD